MSSNDKKNIFIYSTKRPLNCLVIDEDFIYYDCHQFHTDSNLSINWMMTDIAEDYFYNHDGWEVKNWPIIFYVWDKDKKFLGEYSVEVESVPSFYCRKIES